MDDKVENEFSDNKWLVKEVGIKILGRQLFPFSQSERLKEAHYELQSLGKLKYERKTRYKVIIKLFYWFSSKKCQCYCLDCEHVSSVRRNVVNLDLISFL